MKIFLVRHGGTVRVILTKILQPKENIFGKIALENGSITVLNIEKNDQKIKYRIER
ncbi:MAG: histidine phosphatase family protein [Candidatus Heimdallarchaeaceae archaeon]